MSTIEVVVIAVVVLLLFGARKLPEFARGITKARKEFKDGIKDDENSKDN